MAITGRGACAPPQFTLALFEPALLELQRRRVLGDRPHLGVDLVLDDLARCDELLAIVAIPVPGADQSITQPLGEPVRVDVKELGGEVRVRRGRRGVQPHPDRAVPNQAWGRLGARAPAPDAKLVATALGAVGHQDCEPATGVTEL